MRHLRRRVPRKRNQRRLTLHTKKENVRVRFEEAGISMTYPHLNVHLDTMPPSPKEKA